MSSTAILEKSPHWWNSRFVRRFMRHRLHVVAGEALNRLDQLLLFFRRRKKNHL